MTILHIIFYVFALLGVASALMVVISKNSVHGVLFLVLTFCAMSGIWLLLDAEFLALILVLVYVGAVMTLFLFVVMMLNLDKEAKRESFVKYLPVAALIVLTVIGLIIMVLNKGYLGITTGPVRPADYSNTAELGSVLYTNYAFPFEVAGALLLTAIVAAICLTHRSPKNRKVQSASKQINIKRDDFIKLVDLPSEKKLKPGQSS